jgi:hypothetical protein
MTSLVICPDCQRKLKVPESAVGKSIHCPTCKALIPLVSEPELTTLDSDSSETDAPSRSRAVRTTPPLRSAAARPRIRPPQDEEPEDNVEPAAEKSIRKKSSRRRGPIRKKSSAGLIIGLTVGGVVLLLVLLAGGAGLLLHFVRNRPVPQAEWQTFAPPNGNCSVLMPGTPQSQPMTTLGLTINKYLVTRVREKAFFVVAFANFGPDPLQPNALEIVMNAERDHLLRTLNGKVTSETPITLGNLPGREFQLATVPQGTVIERIYLAKVGDTHRVYLAVAAGDNITPNQGDATRFFDSFKIDGAAMPPTFLDAAAPQNEPKPPPVVNPPPPSVVNPPPANPQPNPPRTIPRPRPPRRPLPGR